MINNRGRRYITWTRASPRATQRDLGPGLVVGHDDVWNVSADNGTHQSLPASPVATAATTHTHTGRPASQPASHTRLREYRDRISITR